VETLEITIVQPGMFGNPVPELILIKPVLLVNILSCFALDAVPFIDMGSEPLYQVVDVGRANFYFLIAYIKVERGSSILILLELLVGIMKVGLPFGLFLFHCPDFDFLLDLLLLHMGE
jgi:hypothetical protein